MKFAKFTENNDHEGETWHFWLQLGGQNTREFKRLEALLDELDPNGEQYSLDMTPVDESEVDILVKHSEQGYMLQHNKVTGNFVCPTIIIDSDDAIEELDQELYKGGIERHFKVSQ